MPTAGGLSLDVDGDRVTHHLARQEAISPGSWRWNSIVGGGAAAA
jgi:hypothetical protein